jgi:hypothetical protein
LSGRKIYSSFIGTRQAALIAFRRPCNLRGISGIVQCGFYFHPCDEDPSPGLPERKKPRDSIGSALHELKNCCGSQCRHWNLLITEIGAVAEIR